MRLPRLLCKLQAVAATLVILAPQAQAQTIPDAGTLLRESERQERRLPAPAPQAVPQTPAAAPKDELRVVVKSFRISGNTLIATPELQAVLAPWIGKEGGFAELQQAVNAIAEEYRRRGWFARPQLPAQDVNEGVIEINVIEGRLGAVRIDDGGAALRVDRGLIEGTMTARQKPGDPLDLELLERSNSILNDTPGIAVATVLAPGANAGETDAVVKVQDKPLAAGMLQLDNQGARSTGKDKLSASGSLDNPLGIGDQAQLYANASQGSDYLKLGYSLPFGRDGLRAGIGASAMKYHLVGDFAVSKSKGDAQTLGLNASYPLLRSGTRNVALALAADRKDYHNEANQVSTSQKKIDALVVALSGDGLDGLGQGGMTLWGLNLAAGRVDLAGNAANATADQNGARTGGSYTKLGYSLSRLQRASDEATLWASFNGQRAGKNLDSSEKLSLGGPSGVRAYPVIEGIGDDGFVGTLEARYSVLPELQLTALYDFGSVRQSHDTSYTGAPLANKVTLRGAGLGMGWSQPGKYSLRAVWARRIGANPLQNPLSGKDSDGSLDLNRVWLTAVAYF